MSFTKKFQVIIPPQKISEKPDCLNNLSKGDSNAFEWLYKNYSRKVFDYAFLLTGEAATSEDIVQEVFLMIWFKREKLSAIENFDAWLHTISRNYVVDQIKKRAAVMQHQKGYRYYE